MLNPADGGEELATTAEEVEAMIPRIRYELSKRPLEERRFIAMQVWKNGLPDGLEPIVSPN